MPIPQFAWAITSPNARSCIPFLVFSNGRRWTIELRQHLGKPTWLVIEPNKPLEEGHISWSRAVDDALDGWERISLVGSVKGGGRKGKGLTIQGVDSPNSTQPTKKHKTIKL